MHYACIFPIKINDKKIIKIILVPLFFVSDINQQLIIICQLQKKKIISKKKNNSLYVICF